MFAHAMNKSPNGMNDQLLIEICLPVLGRLQVKQNISPEQKFEKVCVSNQYSFKSKMSFFRHQTSHQPWT